MRNHTVLKLNTGRAYPDDIESKGVFGMQVKCKIELSLADL